jgi:hypothetical protein
MPVSPYAQRDFNRAWSASVDDRANFGPELQLHDRPAQDVFGNTQEVFA